MDIAKFENLNELIIEIRNEKVLLDADVSGLTNAMLDYVFDQPSTLPHQLYLMLIFAVEKIEAFFGVNF